MNYDELSETQVGSGTRANQIVQHNAWTIWISKLLDYEPVEGWDYKLLFATLTFSNMEDGKPPSLGYARRSRNKYVEFIRENCTQVIKLFVAEEKGKDYSNRLHYHWLMLCRTNAANRHFKPLGLLAEQLKSGWEFGIIKDVQIVADKDAIANYVTKYVTKDLSLTHVPEWDYQDFTR